MSFKKLLESKIGAFIFGISILMICFACIIIKIFCGWGLQDVRQRSKIVPHKQKKEEKEDINNVQLTINPYNFVKVIETETHTIHENLQSVDIVLIEI